MASMLRLIVLAIAMVSANALRVPVVASAQPALARTSNVQMAMPSVDDARNLSSEEIEQELVTAKKVRRPQQTAAIALPPLSPLLQGYRPAQGTTARRPLCLNLLSRCAAARRSFLSCGKRSRQGRRCAASALSTPRRVLTRRPQPRLPAPYCPAARLLVPLSTNTPIVPSLVPILHACQCPQVKPHLFTHTKHRIGQLQTLLSQRAA